MTKYQMTYKGILYSDEEGEIEIEGRNYNFYFLFRDGNDYVPINERSELEIKSIHDIKQKALETCIESIRSNIRFGLPANQAEVEFECEELKFDAEQN